MRRLVLVLILAALLLTLAACKEDKSSDDNQPADSDSALGLFDWNRDPNTIIVRLDAKLENATPDYLTNSIPPCTMWGDGRVVWITRTDTGAQEVLEARVGEAGVRSFLEDIINRGFYNWQDEIIPPNNANTVFETITVNLYDEIRTIRRYSAWPQNGYAAILQNCQALSDKPVRVLPDAGWISAYPVARDQGAPTWHWPADAPFTLQELVEKGEARWLTGELASYIWLSARQVQSNTQVVDANENAYHLAIAVPNVSRDAAAAPAEAPTPAPPSGTSEATDASGS